MGRAADGERLARALASPRPFILQPRGGGRGRHRRAGFCSRGGGGAGGGGTTQTPSSLHAAAGPCSGAGQSASSAQTGRHVERGGGVAQTQSSESGGQASLQSFASAHGRGPRGRGGWSCVPSPVPAGGTSPAFGGGGGPWLPAGGGGGGPSSTHTPVRHTGDGPFGGMGQSPSSAHAGRHTWGGGSSTHAHSMASGGQASSHCASLVQGGGPCGGGGWAEGSAPARASPPTSPSASPGMPSQAARPVASTRPERGTSETMRTSAFFMTASGCVRRMCATQRRGLEQRPCQLLRAAPAPSLLAVAPGGSSPSSKRVFSSQTGRPRSCTPMRRVLSRRARRSGSPGRLRYPQPGLRIRQRGHGRAAGGSSVTWP